MIAISRPLRHNDGTHTGRIAAVIGVILMVVGMVTAPGTATVTAADPAGRTLAITVVGAQNPKVRVRGPGKYDKVVRVDGVRVLRKLRPGKYTLTAKPQGDLKPTDSVKKVRVRKAKAVAVTFRYRGPDVTPPGPVTDLRAVEVTATSVRLVWTNPPDGDFLQVQVTRKGGTEQETGNLVLDDDGKGLREDGLSRNTEYTYTVATEDEAGNVSAGVSITVRTLP
jgi:hypothetical protein